MIHYAIHIICFVIIVFCICLIVHFCKMNRKLESEFESRVKTISKMHQDHEEYSRNQYEQILATKNKEIETLQKQVNNTYDRRDPTIVRINNVYPVKLEASVRFNHYELEAIEPELKEKIILDRLLDGMSEDLKKMIEYRKPDYIDPVNSSYIVVGRLNVIPKYDYLNVGHDL